jgi:hypothetical protein
MGLLKLVLTILMDVLILIASIYVVFYALVPFVMICVIVARHDSAPRKREEQEQREKNTVKGYIMTDEELDRMYGGPW